jgi:hypothetical protein
LFDFVVSGNNDPPKTQHVEDAKAKEASTAPTELEHRNIDGQSSAETAGGSNDTSVDVTATTTGSIQFQDLLAVDKTVDISEAAEIFLEHLESSTSSDITRTSTTTCHQNVRQNHPLANRENFLLMFICGATVGVTHLYWEDIIKNQLPLQVVALWLSLFFLEGYIVAENRCDAAYKVVLDQMQEQLNLLSQASLPNAKNRPEDASMAQQRRTFLESILRLNYSAERVKVPSLKAERTLVLPKGFFSCLQKESSEPAVSEILIKRLLRSESHTRTPDGMGIIPICKYRGMDILLTDSPEDPIYKNRHLNELVVKCSLRHSNFLLFL